MKGCAAEIYVLLKSKNANYTKIRGLHARCSRLPFFGKRMVNGRGRIGVKMVGGASRGARAAFGVYGRGNLREGPRRPRPYSRGVRGDTATWVASRCAPALQKPPTAVRRPYQARTRAVHAPYHRRSTLGFRAGIRGCSGGDRALVGGWAGGWGAWAGRFWGMKRGEIPIFRDGIGGEIAWNPHFKDMARASCRGGVSRFFAKIPPPTAIPQCEFRHPTIKRHRGAPVAVKKRRAAATCRLIPRGLPVQDGGLGAGGLGANARRIKMRFLGLAGARATPNRNSRAVGGGNPTLRHRCARGVGGAARPLCDWGSGDCKSAEGLGGAAFAARWRAAARLEAGGRG